MAPRPTTELAARASDRLDQVSRWCSTRSARPWPWPCRHPSAVPGANRPTRSAPNALPAAPPAPSCPLPSAPPPLSGAKNHLRSDRIFIVIRPSGRPARPSTATVDAPILVIDGLRTPRPAWPAAPAWPRDRLLRQAHRLPAGCTSTTAGTPCRATRSIARTTPPVAGHDLVPGRTQPPRCQLLPHRPQPTPGIAAFHLILHKFLSQPKVYQPSKGRASTKLGSGGLAAAGSLPSCQASYFENWVMGYRRLDRGLDSWRTPRAAASSARHPDSRTAFDRSAPSGQQRPANPP